MTFGHGQPPSGWPPPSDPGPRAPGRRRAPDDEDEPTSGYEGRAFHAPAPPPVPEAPYRPRRARKEPPSPTPAAPRRPSPAPWPDRHHGTTPYPVDWDGLRHDGGAPPVPVQWSAAPVAEPEIDLPHRPRGSRPRARRAARARRRTSPWLNALGIAAVAVLVGVCAAGGYIMFNHGGTTGATADGSAAPPPTPHDISNRQADPAPLTEAEIFPGPTVTPAGYLVLKTQAAPDCKTVAVGEPGKVLTTAGCTQVVRATLVSPDKVYVLTAGVANLDSQAGAQQANDGLRTAVGAQKGRFTGYDVGGASVVFGQAATQLGWDVRGHFLGYCVVARVDGKPLDGTDPGARQIIDDLVEKYLIGTVLQARVSPSQAPPAAPTPKKSGN